MTFSHVPPFMRFLFPYKEKKLAISSRNPVLFLLLQNKLSLALINWTFQGVRGMGVTDLFGKICIEILIVSVTLILVNGAIIFRLIIALLIAHTFSWFFNSHFWVLGRYLGITRTFPARFPAYLNGLMQRLDNCRAINSVIVIGGASRKQGIKPTSDVDIFFIRSPGFFNGISAVMTTVQERARAFLCKFPLHLEMYDEIETMNKHRKDEMPFVLKDDLGRAADYYSAQGRNTAGFEEYRDEAPKTT